MSSYRETSFPNASLLFVNDDKTLTLNDVSGEIMEATEGIVFSPYMADIREGRFSSLGHLVGKLNNNVVEVIYSQQRTDFPKTSAGFQMILDDKGALQKYLFMSSMTVFNIEVADHPHCDTFKNYFTRTLEN